MSFSPEDVREVSMRASMCGSGKSASALSLEMEQLLPRAPHPGTCLGYLCRVSGIRGGATRASLDAGDPSL